MVRAPLGVLVPHHGKANVLDNNPGSAADCVTSDKSLILDLRFPLLKMGKEFNEHRASSAPLSFLPLPTASQASLSSTLKIRPLKGTGCCCAEHVPTSQKHAPCWG